MSFLRRPLNWLGLAAFAAGFWITFRVLTASAPALPVRGDLALEDEGENAALQRLVAGFGAQVESERDGLARRPSAFALANR